MRGHLFTLLSILISKMPFTHGNVCDTTDNGMWVSCILFAIEDFAYGGAPLNNYTCFDGCIESNTVAQSYRLKTSVLPTTLISRKAVGGRAADNDPAHCPPDLGADVQKNVNKAVDNTAKSVLRALLYNMGLPGGWAYGVAKNGQGWSDAPNLPIFCYYEATLEGDEFQITLAYVG